jgi:drug/metabolite transporter (DMT)-like permease
MLLATVLALGAAVIHAGWNLVAKRAEGDRYLVLWAQFLVGGVVCLPLMVGHQLLHGLPWQAYLWALASGCVHLPYTWLLARAYSSGDFSVSYPVARGGGAALAALGGVLLLGDRLTGFEVLGIAIVVMGLSLLAFRARAHHVGMALAVAVTIGAYTTFDAKGSRAADTVAYVFASTVGTALTNSVFALSTGRGPALVQLLRTNWRRSALTGVASTVTYGMVLVAVRYAPVGYVAALRESSVVLAALIGWRMLGEGDHRRRLTAAAVVFGGLLVLVLGR